MSYLSISKLHFARQHRMVIDGISLDVDHKKIIGLIGTSGAGKTTLLRLIAGFEMPTSGSIVLNDQVLHDDKHSLSPDKRGVGMVFQQASLFPHLSVEENIAFGLRKLNASKRAERVASLLEHIGLSDRKDAMPHELSGGQQQRVALARSLAPSVSLLLLDEPFSGLDPERRTRLGDDTRALIQAEEVTTLLVTHDHAEAKRLCDEIYSLGEDGKLVKQS
ncbi:MAG: ABC transporter ATP-binding protein [Rickettsiales bacterium]|nr:ABC transporter ATP-binding protein [Rickettsiales bacterium]